MHNYLFTSKNISFWKLGTDMELGYCKNSNVPKGMLILKGDESMAAMGLNFWQQIRETRLSNVLKTFSRERIKADVTKTRKCKQTCFSYRLFSLALRLCYRKVRPIISILSFTYSILNMRPCSSNSFSSTVDVARVQDCGALKPTANSSHVPCDEDLH